MTLLEAARPFVAVGQKMLVSLPDRARLGIGEVTAGDFRMLVALDSAGEEREWSWIPALRPFAAAGKMVPEEARDWDFGTTGLKYGDFMRVAEVMEGSMPRSVEDGGERKPLEYSYDLAHDILTIDGIQFTGDVFRTWNRVMPADRFYKFDNSKGPLVITQVVPCEKCQGEFQLLQERVQRSREESKFS